MWATAVRSSIARAITGAIREIRVADAETLAAGPPGVVPAATGAKITAVVGVGAPMVARSIRGGTAQTPIDTNVITHTFSLAQCCLAGARWTSCFQGSLLHPHSPKDTSEPSFCLQNPSKCNSLIGQSSSKVPSDPRRDVPKSSNPEEGSNPGDFSNFPEISQTT